MVYKVPVKTEAPVVYKVPAKTAAPVVYKVPVKTAAPVVYQVPVATKAPEVVVSGARIYSPPPPPDVRLALLLHELSCAKQNVAFAVGWHERCPSFTSCSCQKPLTFVFVS